MIRYPMTPSPICRVAMTITPGGRPGASTGVAAYRGLTGSIEVSLRDGWHADLTAPLAFVTGSGTRRQ